MPFIEIWYWEPIFFFNGHIALKLGDYTYNFEYDQRPRHERKLLNSKRVSTNPLTGGWAGRLNKRTIEQEADIFIDQWINSQMKWKIAQLFVYVFRFEVSDIEYNSALMFFDRAVGNEPEYSFYSPDNSKNCVTFIVDAINEIGLLNYDIDFSITHEELQSFNISIPESTNKLFEKYSERLRKFDCDSLNGPWPWIFFVRLMQEINLANSDTSKFRGYHRKQVAINNSYLSLLIFARLIQALCFAESKIPRIRRLIKKYLETKGWFRRRVIIAWIMQAMDFAESKIPRIRRLIKKSIVNKQEWLVVEQKSLLSNSLNANNSKNKHYQH